MFTIRRYAQWSLPIIVMMALMVSPIGFQPAAAQSELLTATTWYVEPTGSDFNSCADTSAPCATINGAIGKASAGDTIDVAVVTYTGTNWEAVWISKELVLSGGWDSGFTTQIGFSTIDGETVRRGITVYLLYPTVIDHFIVQNGFASGDYGGGVYNAGMLTLNDSIISDNYADQMGGGIYSAGPLTLNRSVVKNNRSHGAGGGIGSNNILTINDSTISNNTSEQSKGRWDSF